MDEIKKIAIVKEVNLTKVRQQIKNLEQLVAQTEDEADKAYHQERLDKGKKYLKDVEEATEMGELEKGKAVKGVKNKPLKDSKK